MTNEKWQEVKQLTEESARAYERRYKLLYWCIIIVIGMLSFILNEKLPTSVLLLPLILVILLMLLDFHINEQILFLETYRKIFYESDNENNFKETAKVKYYELEESKMNFFQKISHYIFNHAEFHVFYSIILLVCLITIFIRARKEDFTFTILSSFIVLILIFFFFAQYFRLQLRRKKKEKLWQKVREELRLN